MPSTKPHHINGCQPPDQPEHLPCPRCDSTNTKFCYYNNYNFSQPRHFCKACRRYWTHGGTLRDIPVGGGSRKNAKRSRVTTNNNNNIYTNYILEYQKMVPTTTAPIMFPLATGLHNNSNSDININVNVNNELCYGKPVVSVSDSFTSLLNGVNGPGMFGLGVGGLEDGFGFGRGNTWQLDGSGNTWQLDGGEGLSLPELAICTPGMI